MGPVIEASAAVGVAASLEGHGAMVERHEPEPSWKSLVVRARQGDAEAFDAIMLAHQRQVFATAWRLLGSVEDAQDAAQEVFLRLFRHLHRLDEERSPGPWLYRVTVNVCRSAGRRRRAREARACDDPGRAVEALPSRDPSTDPAAALRALEERRVAGQGLRTLTSKEREALVLRDVQGLTTREVARAMGNREVTVRSHLSRARLKMREHRSRYLRGNDS